MSPDAIASILTGAGVAGVWVLSFLFGWVHTKSYVDDLKEQNAELRAALVTERSRADAAVEAAQTSNLLLAGIRSEVGRL